MRPQDLKTRIFSLFFAVIFLFSFLVFFAGGRMIKNDVIARAQRQITNDLRVAHSMFNGEIEAIRRGFNLISPDADLSAVKAKMGLDYLYIVRTQDRASVKSEIVQRAFTGQPTGGIRIIEEEELRAMGEEAYQKYKIDLRSTPLARVSQEKVLEEAMAIGYAQPVFDAAQKVEGVIYGGKFVNRDFGLVDKIRDLVFEDKVYDKKPLGTVTIFLRDIRIATNVLDRDGERAIGTAVSETVSKKVLEEGQPWLDRAFVVTDWYLTGYEPLRNIDGKIIGMLYVGMLEKPFKDLERRVLWVFLAIILFVGILSVVLSYLLAFTIARPAREMVAAMRQVSGGDLAHRIETTSDIRELNELALSFNEMASKLQENDESLRASHEKLAALNTSYLDLIGFVAHELKGILSSTIMNAYSVRDGFLGLVNFKQRKALDSVTRNLDYLESTVKNFLNLSRIEKGELAAHKADLFCKEDIFDPAVENFVKPINEKGVQIENRIEPSLKAKGDVTLLQIVANNLLSNAVKYVRPEGKIVLLSRRCGTLLQFEVYNDGAPIDAGQAGRLFRKFSRIGSVQDKKVQGTGLGLFISKEIVEKHGGTIWFEPRESGNAFIVQIEQGA